MFSNATDLRIAVESILTNLVYSPTIDSNIFEKAVLEIGNSWGMILQDLKKSIMMVQIICGQLKNLVSLLSVSKSI